MSETPFSVGDRITLKRAHPCGGSEWVIYRIGADIRLKCLKCERRVFLSRKDAERRTVSRIPAPETTAPDENGGNAAGDDAAANETSPGPGD